MAKWAMVIDLDRCAGCGACNIACNMENSTDPAMTWRKIVAVSNETPAGGLKTTIIPRPCQMCENAACEKVCPTRATHYDAEGTVQIDYDKCIGCKYCMSACPYGVRKFNKTTAQEKPSHNPDVPKRPHGVVEKCTYCQHRRKKGDYTNTDHGKLGRMTACAQICAPAATWFGDLDDPNSKVSQLVKSGRAFQLRGEMKTKPRTYYLSGG